MKEQSPDLRDFFDYEKTESTRSDAEVDAIVQEIYRSVVGGNDGMPGPEPEAETAGGTAVRTPPHPASRLRPREKKKKHRLARVALCLLLCALLGYGVAIYGNIPLIRKWRDIYIETAMGTMTHQWLATAFIPPKVIDEVMDTRTDIETVQEEIDTNWTTETLKGAEKKTKWEKLRRSFFDLYSEIDEESFEAYIEKNGDACIDSEGYLVIDEADIGAPDTGILTKAGDEVLAIDTKNGITIVRVTGSDYEGRLAIIKSAAQVKVALAPAFGEVGSTIGTIAQKNDAVLAVNASGFYDPEGHGNGGVVHGLVIKDGKTYSDFAGGNNKTIGFDYDDNLQIGIYRDGANLRDAVEFKPALIFDGKQMVEGSAGWGISPRTAIGQTKNGQVLLLVVDGRQAGYSIGCTMGDLADILLRYDAYQACNLDGGSSSIMYYNGRKITRPSAANKEEGRRLPDAFIVTER